MMYDCSLSTWHLHFFLTQCVQITTCVTLHAINEQWAWRMADKFVCACMFNVQMVLTKLNLSAEALCDFPGIVKAF